MDATRDTGPRRVRHFRQILLWPLQLLPDAEGSALPPTQLLGAGTWREVVDEVVSGIPLQQRHYSEFVTFLPYVQRFLYGEPPPAAQGAAAGPGDLPPMRVFRRSDVVSARATVRPGEAPVDLQVQHVDLYFFRDLDLVLLNVEVSADELPLNLAQELMYRFGRGYPGGWDDSGQALHCLHGLEWLDAEGRVLARSDAQQRERFLAFVAAYRSPRIAEHWVFVLQPLVPDAGELAGPGRYRQIEYYRMPMMAYLAVDDPGAISRSDFVRLGLVTGGGAALPYAEEHLADFERQHCYDRFWCDHGVAPRTRYVASGHALVVVGDADSAFYRCAERGVLAQFRHQHYLLFLIAHVQKAALLMYSDRLVDALKRLDLSDADSIRRFKRTIRLTFASFLRFTHRYWFHEISEQAQVRALYRLTSDQLEVGKIFDEVKQRIADMNGYLESDSLRRQANTVVRLTVVTVFGLVGTITTGFLGMNLIAYAEQPLSDRLTFFAVVFGLTTALTLFTIARSKRLSDFLDAMSDERLALRHKLDSLLEVFRAPRRR